MSDLITADEQSVLEIWKKMTSRLSKREKEIFNEWRFRLWLNVDRQRDDLRIRRIRPSQGLTLIDAIYKQVQEIPVSR